MCRDDSKGPSGPGEQFVGVQPHSHAGSHRPMRPFAFFTLSEMRNTDVFWTEK